MTQQCSVLSSEVTFVGAMALQIFYRHLRRPLEYIGWREKTEKRQKEKFNIFDII